MNDLELASNTKTPAEVLAELAKDENWHVRDSAASNSNTPAESLAELAKDENFNENKNKKIKLR